MTYIVLLILILLYSTYPYVRKNSRQANKFFLFFAFFTMTLVLGLRGTSVGEDTQHYLDIFMHSENVKWTDILHSTGFRTGYYTNQYGYTDTIETGFLILAKIFHWFTDEGQIFLFVIAALTCGFFAKFIYDNCEQVVFPTLIFLFESMFMSSFNGIRQMLAVAITIQAYTLVKNEKWKKAIVVILVAAFIHNVALVAFALFPVMLIKPKKQYRYFKYAMIITVLSPFIVIAAQSIISRVFPRYASYFTTNYWTNGVGGTAVIWLIEFVLIWILYRMKFRTKDSFKLSCLVLIYLVCELMGVQIAAFSRVGLFFRSYLLLFFPECKAYFTKKSWRVIQGVLLMLMFLLYISYARTPARIYSFFWQ